MDGIITFHSRIDLSRFRDYFQVVPVQVTCQKKLVSFFLKFRETSHVINTIYVIKKLILKTVSILRAKFFARW